MNSFHTKLAAHLLSVRLPRRGLKLQRTLPPSGEAGIVMGAVMIAILAIIIATVAITSKSFDGLLGSIFQGQAKEARVAAESGTAFIISEWNKPRNRMLYAGLPMANWAANNAALLNRCTAPGPNFEASSASQPESSALQFANGNEISIGGDNSRRFVLRRATFKRRDRTSSFSTTAASSTGSSPIILPTQRGFVELEVEGRIYNGSTLVSSSIITREFEIEAKCCDRSFGRVQPSDPLLGNDSRTCDGQSSYNIGDLGIVTGLNGGGLTRGSGSGSLSVTLEDGRTQLEEIICTPPAGQTSCGGTFRDPSLNTDQRENIDITIKPIVIPPPPSAPAGLSASLNVTGGLALNPATRTNECVLAQNPAGSAEAYHCKVSNINLSGSGAVLTIDTTAYPVYLYLQGNNNNISVTGNGQIRHIRNGVDAPLSDARRFQIRGINQPLTSPASNTTQTFDMAGNGTSAFTIWAPYADTKITGTATYGGILWTNDLTLGGTGETRIAIPSNTGTCIDFPGATPCQILEDTGNTTTGLSPTDWAARSITFTRMFKGF